MRYVLLCGALAPMLLAAGADAAVITIVPDHLVKGTNQKLQVQVSGAEPVFGLDFYLQFGDGGAALGGNNTAPVITSVDFLTGTIFAPNNSGQTDINSDPLVYAGGVTTNSGTVPASGLLATLTLDTSQLAGDTFILKLKGVAGSFDTQLTDINGDPISLTIPDPVIIAVPEPAMLMGLGALGSVLLLRVRRG